MLGNRMTSIFIKLSLSGIFSSLRVLSLGALFMFLMFSVLLINGETRADQFFKTPSTWYDKIPANPLITPNSSNYVADMIINNGILTTEYRQWSIPIFYANNATPITTVTLKNPDTVYGKWMLLKHWNEIPIPADALPSNSADGYCAIINTVTNEYWEMARVTKSGNSWDADVTRKWNLTTETGDWSPKQPYDLHGGAQVSGVPLIKGLITYSEIQKGVIDHALMFGYSATRKAAHWGVYPAYKYNAGVSERLWAMVEGMRLQLNPALDCSTLGLNRYGQIVCKALQEYGMILTINSGPGSNNFIAESLENKPESWIGIIGSLNAIPLKQFRVVEPVCSDCSICPNCTSKPPSPPIANFTGSPTSGTAPLNVTFTDTSTGSPTSWSWDFGDGSTSTLQNPSHTYKNPGSYTISHTATNAYGSNTKTATSYVTVQSPPPPLPGPPKWVP